MGLFFFDDELPPAYEAREPKTCELCGKQFTRKIGDGTAYCQECLTKNPHLTAQPDYNRTKCAPKHSRSKTHCRRGHGLVLKNLVYDGGKVRCKLCANFDALRAITGDNKNVGG